MTTLNKENIQKEFKARLSEDELLNCMRCGFCLPTCPTYIQSGYKESHSPRGRIALMKAVVDGLIEPDEDVENTLNVCLGCRACEPVCPSGVNYGHLLEEARDIMGWRTGGCGRAEESQGGRRILRSWIGRRTPAPSGGGTRRRATRRFATA